jgi:hypothetical protein
MVLARDLLSAKGALLLAAGYVFEDRVIRQIREFVSSEGVRLTLHVRRVPGGRCAPPDTAEVRRGHLRHHRFHGGAPCLTAA